MNSIPPEIGTVESAKAPRPHRSPWLAVLGVTTGCLSVVTALGTAVMGMGFGNATASGTGAAALALGVWTLGATRGLMHRRPMTYVGLSLAWAWLLARIILDLPATGSSMIVALFLLPLVTLPLGVGWLLCGSAMAMILWMRAPRMLRSLAAESARPEIIRQSAWLAAKLGLLVLVTIGAPQIVWLDRESKIHKLAQEYGPPSTAPHADRGPAMGACTMVFLGYQLTDSGGSKKSPSARQAAYDKSVADARAEVNSIVAAGAKYIRVGASGDHLLENKPGQEDVDDSFMASVRQTGRDLVLVDTQHPKILQRRKLTWDEFCAFQRRRIDYYEKRYRPAAYFVVCEPLSYHSFALSRDARFSAAAWAAQLSDMCRLVKSIDPATRTGICLLVMKDREPEWDVWSSMKTLPELDVLSVEIYQPEDFELTRLRLDKYGHPGQVNKRFWIAETYNGWALCGDRRWDLDAEWVRVSAYFGTAMEAEAVLVWTFGSFAPGGSFWDLVRPGRFKERWGAGDKLSRVAEEFLRQSQR